MSFLKPSFKSSVVLASVALISCQPLSSPVPAVSPRPQPVVSPVVTPQPVATPQPSVAPVPQESPSAVATPTPMPVASSTPLPAPSPSTTAEPSAPPIPTPVPELAFARIKTIAGLAESGIAENGSRADESPLPERISALEVDDDGNIWILDRSNGRLVYITAEISRPSTDPGSVPDYRLFWVRKTDLNSPSGMAFDRQQGAFYIVEQDAHRVIKVSRQDFSQVVVAGNGRQGYTGDGLATEQSLDRPTDVALGPDGSLYISDTGNHLIRRLTVDGALVTVAGQYVQDTKVVDTDDDGKLDDEVPSFLPVGETSGDGGSALQARLNRPTSLAVSPNGDLYFSSKSNTIRRIRKGVIERFAGSGQQGYNNDNYNALLAHFGQPEELLVGPDGLLYFIDTLNYRIRRIRSNGFIQDLVGNGKTREYVSSLTNLKTMEIEPTVQIFDSRGNLYVYDRAHYRLRMAEVQNEIKEPLE